MTATYALCPSCASSQVRWTSASPEDPARDYFECEACGTTWIMKTEWSSRVPRRMLLRDGLRRPDHSHHQKAG